MAEVAEKEAGWGEVEERGAQERVVWASEDEAVKDSVWEVEDSVWEVEEIGAEVVSVSLAGWAAAGSWSWLPSSRRPGMPTQTTAYPPTQSKRMGQYSTCRDSGVSETKDIPTHAQRTCSITLSCHSGTGRRLARSPRRRTAQCWAS